MPRRLLFLLPVVVFLALAAVIAAFMLSGTDPRVVPSALLDKPVPTFVLPAIDGAERGLSTADLKGKVSVVNVFASWCVPCLAEHPQIMALAEDKDIALVGINYKDKAADADAWLKRLGNPFRAVGADRDGRVSIDWGVYGVPETFFIDRGGTIRYKHVGPITPQDLKDKILPLVARLKK
ncbi:MAG TPA: DsbE family thiol:disulfide interchange protein [Alphaproteobacteria bacterium]|nr:DsbE family thiol:disulfide interchange protein [Alphaproteobacteria bacterium]